MPKAVSSSPEREHGDVAGPASRSFYALDALAVAMIAFLAFLIRLPHLATRSLSLDDGFSIFLAQTDWASFRHWLWRSEMNMSLYYFALRLWQHAGSSEFMLRLLSVLFAAATVPVVYALGARLFGRGTGVIASLLFALLPFDVVLSQQVRSYPLLILLVALSSLCFLRLVEKPSAENSVGYAVLSAAAMYSHFFAALVIFAQWLWLFAGRRKLRPALLAAAALFIALLVPAGLYLLHSQCSPIAWVPKPNLRQALDVLYSLTLSKERCLAYLGMWAIGFWCAFRLDQKRAWAYRFVSLWLVAPLAIAACASFFQPMWIARYFAICIPASVLLAAAGVTQLARWSRAASVVMLLVMLVYSTSAIRFYHRHLSFTIDWQTPMTYLLARAQTGDRVVIDPYVGFLFDYYRKVSPSPQTPLEIASSLADPLPQPVPGNVWAIAPVWTNPDDPSSGPEAIHAEAKDFVASHQGWYCQQPPWPQGASVEVWQFQRCGQSSNQPGNRTAK